MTPSPNPCEPPIRLPAHHLPCSDISLIAPLDQTAKRWNTRLFASPSTSTWFSRWSRTRLKKAMPGESSYAKYEAMSRRVAVLAPITLHTARTVLPSAVSQWETCEAGKTS